MLGLITTGSSNSNRCHLVLRACYFRLCISLVHPQMYSKAKACRKGWVHSSHKRHKNRVRSNSNSSSSNSSISRLYSNRRLHKLRRVCSYLSITVTKETYLLIVVLSLKRVPRSFTHPEAKILKLVVKSRQVGTLIPEPAVRLYIKDLFKISKQNRQNLQSKYSSSSTSSSFQMI